MDNIARQQKVQSVRNQVGWVYRDLLWFSEQEGNIATKQRDELLAAVAGWVSYSFHDTKPHSGPLSPGCLICGSGGWDCNFIIGLCTRHCFYCPQDPSIRAERESSSDGMIFKNPAEHIRFLKTFQIRGVGFSGGEPSIVLDRVLSHISAIRQEFGNSLYLWMYSNGDRLDRSALKELQNAGLNEVRIDLSARNYDLAPLVLSKEYIPTVTVEIPAIPEDFSVLTELLGKLEAAGVNFLNLHQLTATAYNYRALRQRHYHFLHQSGIPIFESEICALRLLLFAREHGIQLPINYCCSAYKQRFQGRDRRTRQGRAVLKGFEEITAAGYIRSFSVRDSNDKIESMLRRLEQAHCPTDWWKCDERKMEVAVHSDLLPFVDWSSADVRLVYLAPGVELRKPSDGIDESNLIPNNSVVYKRGDWSKVGIESWRKLYREKANSNDVLRFFFQNYPAVKKGTISRLQTEIAELKKIAKWEELEGGLPAIF